MIYRRFGKTGLQMPVLSAGFMRAMHSWQRIPHSEIPSASQSGVTAIVRRALELGITHLETARDYGTSDEQLGKAVAELGCRDACILQTKVQPLDDPAQFREHCLETIGRLGTERVDLLAIHGINDFRNIWQVCRPGGCLAVARQLQQEGRVGHVGFSGHGPTDVILAALQHEGEGGFDYLNLHWYYIYQVHSPALAAAADRDMGVFIISPTDKGGMLQQPPDKLRELCAPLSPMAFNDCYCLARPGIHTISVGAARPDDFSEHVGALAHLDDPGQLSGIDLRLRREMLNLTGHDRPDSTWERFPSWETTPGYINIPFILWLAHLARGWGMVGYARGRYAKLGREGKWVPGANAAHVRHAGLREQAAAAGLEPEELVRMLEEAHALLAEKVEGGTAKNGFAP